MIGSVTTSKDRVPPQEDLPQQQYDMNSLRMRLMQQGKEEERVLDDIARAGGSMAV